MPANASSRSWTSAAAAGRGPSDAVPAAPSGRLDLIGQVQHRKHGGTTSRAPTRDNLAFGLTPRTNLAFGLTPDAKLGEDSFYNLPPPD